MTSIDLEEFFNWAIKNGRGLLNDACKKNRIDIAKMLLERNVDIEKCMGNPLHTACKYNHVEMVKVLLDHGMDIETLAYGHATPLYSACQQNSIDVIKYLLERGASQDNKNYCPLSIACITNNVEVIKILLDQGINITSDALTYLPKACEDGKIEIVKILLDYGANILSTMRYSYKDSTSIYLTCMNKNLDILKILLQHCVKIDKHYLIEISINYIKPGYRKVIKMLIDYGADVNKHMLHQQMPLDYACRSGAIDIVAMLLHCNANIKGENGFRAIVNARSSRSVEIIKLLLENGADYTSVSKKYINKTWRNAIKSIEHDYKINEISHGVLQDLRFPKVLASLVNDYTTNTKLDLVKLNVI
jgi:ankyrin